MVLIKNRQRQYIFLFVSVLMTMLAIFCLITGQTVHAANGIDMYRLYNHNSGEHFYTKDANERDHLVSVGWKYEGVGWVAPTSGNPVYRLYNRNGGEHHYTVSTTEKNHLVSFGWKDEGVGWYSGGNVPVYREYNPNARANNHNYTPDKNEHNYLIAVGWRNEDIGWYGMGGGRAVPNSGRLGSSTSAFSTSTTSTQAASYIINTNTGVFHRPECSWVG